MVTRDASSLPADVLVEVFLACVDWHIARTSPFTLAQVCGHWRQVALRTRHLWTDIDVANLSRAELSLRRSRGADLDVTWCDERVVDEGEEDMLDSARNCRWLCTQAPRFRSLVIHSGWRNPRYLILRLLPPKTEFPRLEYLVLNLSDNDGRMCRYMLSIQLSARMPNLRHITLWYASPTLERRLSFISPPFP